MSRRTSSTTLLTLINILAAIVLLACGGDDDDGGGLGPGQCDPGDPSCTLRQSVHWHADLAMYINGEPFDFGQEQFLSTEERELGAAAHVHDPRHTVVHIHLEQTTWDEFFKSLGMKLTDFCITMADGEEICADDTNTLTFVVNGVPVDSIRELDISNLQRTVIWYGAESAEDVAAMWSTVVSDEACIPSGDCQARAPEDPELEPCSVLNDTCN
jgi:hypothetical protein